MSIGKRANLIDNVTAVSYETVIYYGEWWTNS